jgi:hypothetical protein
LSQAVPDIQFWHQDWFEVICGQLDARPSWATESMLILMRFLPLTCLILGISLLILGLQLAHSDVAWLARLVGQAGSLNPRILEKARLMPAVLVVTGLEGVCFGFLLLPYRRRIQQYFELLERNIEWKQKWVVLLFSGYGLIGLMGLNFGTVTLAQRVASLGFSDEELVAADFGEQYAVIKALKEQTPETARILIKTRDPIKYLLNYHLFPRRFFIFPDPGTSLAAVPLKWLQKHAINWTLEIRDDNPRQFVLVRLQSSGDE